MNIRNLRIKQDINRRIHTISTILRQDRNDTKIQNRNGWADSGLYCLSQPGNSSQYAVMGGHGGTIVSP